MGVAINTLSEYMYSISDDNMKTSQVRGIGVQTNCENNFPQWLLVGPSCLQSKCQLILYMSQK